jgi:hypothetical protein
LQTQGGYIPAAAAKNATSTILTGVAMMAPELMPKLLELLLELVPRAGTAALLQTLRGPA